MSNLKIAIDCDGVLANFTLAFNIEAQSLFPEAGVDLDYQPKGWDDFGPLTKAQLKAVWAKIVETPNWWMRCIGPYHDNMRALAKALHHKHNVDFYIVTSRTETAGMTLAMQTRAWFSACGIQPEYNYFGIIVVPDWPQKADVYKAMQFAGSIDDKKETVEACDLIEGHEAYLLDRPWNKDAKVKRRISELDTFLARW